MGAAPSAKRGFSTLTIYDATAMRDLVVLMSRRQATDAGFGK